MVAGPLQRSRPSAIVLAVTVAGLALAVPMAVLLVQQFRQLGTSGMPCCDYAVLELGTRAYLRGEQWVGMYSREGWHHPGPAPFLWSGLFRVLPGRSFAEHQVAAATLGIGAVVAVAVAVRRRAGPVGLVAALAAVAVWMARFDIVYWREPWTPITAMSWVIIAAVTAAAYAAGASRWSLLAFAAGASMALQTHLGTAPTIVVALAVVAVHAWRVRGTEIGGPSWSWIAVVVGALWLLPLVDLVFGDHSLARLAKDMLFGDDDVPMARGAVVRALVSIVGLSPSSQAASFGPASPFNTEPSLTPMIIVLALCGVGLGTYAVLTRRRHPFASRLVIVAAGGLVLTGLSLMTANGPFYRYLLFPSLGLGVLLWIGGLLAVVDDLAARDERWRSTLAWCCAAVAVVAAAVAIPAARPPLSEVYADPAANELAAGVAVNCIDLPDPAVISVGGEWTMVVTVAATMERCTTIEISGFVGFIAGPSYEADDDAVPNVFIGVPTADTPDGTDIATSGDQVVRVLDPRP